MATLPTTGMFAFQQSYTFASITDGLSNTLAFTESTVGNPNATLGKINIGIVSIGAAGTAAQFAGAAAPGVTRPATLAGLQGTTRHSSLGCGTAEQQARSWFHGSIAFTLMRHGRTRPNSAKWAYCSNTTSGSAMRPYSEADSYHSGRNQRA